MTFDFVHTTLHMAEFLPFIFLEPPGPPRVVYYTRAEWLHVSAGGVSTHIALSVKLIYVMGSRKHWLVPDRDHPIAFTINAVTGMDINGIDWSRAVV